MHSKMTLQELKCFNLQLLVRWLDRPMQLYLGPNGFAGLHVPLHGLGKDAFCNLSLIRNIFSVSNYQTSTVISTFLSCRIPAGFL